MSASDPFLNANFSRIGKRVTFGKNVSIVADSIKISDDVHFADNISISCRGSFSVGSHGIIGANARVRCNNLVVGHWFYACEGLEIGSGGCNNKDANVSIGNAVGIFERVLINPNSEISIGDNCGIGREVQIWTHGAWLDPFSGFPADFGPVSIGNNVWLPARCIVLPNVSIGDNSVIGINSVINKSVPEGSFAAGCPAKVIKENAYPRVTSDQQRDEILRKIVADWEAEIINTVPDVPLSVQIADGWTIRLVVRGDETTFDTLNKTVEGATNPISEDLRDYLRRRGVKIFTSNFFKSIRN